MRHSGCGSETDSIRMLRLQVRLVFRREFLPAQRQTRLRWMRPRSAGLDAAIRDPRRTLQMNSGADSAKKVGFEGLSRRGKMTYLRELTDCRLGYFHVLSGEGYKLSLLVFAGFREIVAGQLEVSFETAQISYRCQARI